MEDNLTEQASTAELARRKVEEMSFWKSVEHKAQKKHCCELCHKAIQVGEKYSRQTGVVEGDFQDYCLCLRCLWLLKQHPGREVIGDIWELLSDYDYISCPNCGAYNYEIEEVDEDIENLTFSCGKCGNWWLENLSLEELKKGEQEDGDKEETNEKCPNCNIALSQTSWKELETYEGWCFVVYITYCPKCRYIHEVDAD